MNLLSEALVSAKLSSRSLLLQVLCGLVWITPIVGVVTFTHAADTNTPTSPDHSALPTLFIAGDSTAADGAPNAIGWGKQVGEYFDVKKIHVVNDARGGRSSRTFVSEGLWEKLIEQVKPGDTVIIQFGHNDGSDINGERVARGSLPGLGEETQEIDNHVTKQHEVVHTFGWYMRKMISETRAKGAWPILFTLTVRNFWKDDHVERGSGRFDEWIRQLAESEKVPMVDLTKLVAERFDAMPRPLVNAFYPRDHTHTSDDGAHFNAFYVVSGLKGLREQPLIQTLSWAGVLVPTATPDHVFVPSQQPPKEKGGGEFEKWLNLPEPVDPTLPTLWVIGDSTVRNGKGNGYDGQFGWGDPLENYFYPAKVNVVNRAVGGTGARTFRKQWEKIVPRLKAKDVVILQFGHNDNGARGALPGVGDNTEERKIADSATMETVHSFGWYLKQYIDEGRAHGAAVIVCSPVPHNRWNEGKIDRHDVHADWAKTIAEQESAPFLDLNQRLADYYDPLGEEKVTALFADKKVHTGWAGAEISARVVAEALRALPSSPVADYLRPSP